MNDYRIVLSSGGERFVISPDGDGRLIEGGMEGFDCTGFDVRVNSYASGVGGYAVRRRFAEREMSLTFEFDGMGEAADGLRRKLVSMLNPTRDCVIDIEMYGKARRIAALPAGEAEFRRESLSGVIEAEVKFISPSVYFEEAEGIRVQFRDAAPILTFPLNLMAGAGTVGGMYRTTDKAKVSNSGDGECGIVARIRAVGGDVVNPGICLLGGKFVRCPITLSDGHEMVIDTRERRKSVTVDGVQYFSFDRGSEFFSLPAGECEVTVICDSGGEYIDAQIEFSPIYYGI